MKPKAPTVRELKWLAEVQAVLDRCPSKRLGFYTIGDREVTVYDKRFDAAIDASGRDFGPAAYDLDAILGGISFPSNVHSTSG